MDESDVFEGRSKRFLDWFASQPGTTFHPDLKIEDLRHRNAGRGVVATKDIEAEIELFRIPRCFVITAENASLALHHPRFFETVENDGAPQLVDCSEDAKSHLGDNNSVAGNEKDDVESDSLDPWLKLIITLIYEHFQGDESAWKPYLDVLPTDFDTPMFWTPDQLKELQASSLLEHIGRDTADNVFKAKLVPLIRKYQDVFESAEAWSDTELIELAHLFGSTIMAYAFDLQREDDEDEDEGEDGWTEDREGQQLGMVPMADMLNADAEFNAHLNHEDDALVMISLRPIKAGEEVLNYYGPLPNSDLLRRYGYVSVNHGVHDVVELPRSVIIDSVKSRLGVSDLNIRQAVNKLDEDELEDSFVLEYDPVSPDSSGRLPPEAKMPTVTALPETLTIQLKQLLKALRKTKSGFETTDLDFYHVIRTALQIRLQQYGTELLSDEQGLRELESPRVLSQTREDSSNILRKTMAFKVRIGEKKLLTEYLELIERRLAEVQENEPKSKRAKFK